MCTQERALDQGGRERVTGLNRTTLGYGDAIGIQASPSEVIVRGTTIK